MTETLDLFAAAREPSEPGPRVFTVSQINRAVRRLLESELPPFWVGGEVTGWTRARSGHRYFTLKDHGSQLRAVMWRSDAERLPTDPPEGTEVRCYGTLTLYEARGEYQLQVRKLETESAEGLWRIAMERLRAALDSEGLLDPARKRPLPRYPKAVGIVTSTEGAALQDMIAGLRARAPWVHVVVRGARVQGDGATRELARALTLLAESGLVDVVVVGRGGGSLEDLWAFNEEPLARAVARSPVPVVSAVGHETDVTITDLVADARAPTPTGAAAMIVPDRRSVARALEALGDRCLGAARGRVAGYRQRSEAAGSRVRTALPRRLTRLGGRFRTATVRIEALSPLSTLARGYAVPRGPDGSVLRSVVALPDGAAFDLRMVDGSVPCRVAGSALSLETLTPAGPRGS